MDSEENTEIGRTAGDPVRDRPSTSTEYGDRKFVGKRATLLFVPGLLLADEGRARQRTGFAEEGIGEVSGTDRKFHPPEWDRE